ncbi:hypothetical protein ACFQPF_02760 [Fictibacillus iocasae]|uniref:Tryptophan-rich sensory protein n=1 Tax=Fictibacillus iocasae TaxID=2715437 RepID=A0ABW2NN92_9BACL
MNKLLRLLVFLLSLSQPLFAYVMNNSSSIMDENGSEPFITPAGYTFSIWGVIVIGSIAYGVYQVLPINAKKKVYDYIAPYSIITFIGFDAWLLAADQEKLLLTVMIFMIMGIALFLSYRHIVSAAFNTFEKIAVYGTFSLYFGWTTVAIFANIAAALSFYGLPNTGVLWQMAVLIAAAATSLVLLMRFSFPLPYLMTIIWAFTGILVRTTGAGKEVLPLTFLTITAIVVFIVLALRNKYNLRK